MTQKYSPIKQLFYFDTTEVCPQFTIDEDFSETVKSLRVESKNDRYDGLRTVVGQHL